MSVYFIQAGKNGPIKIGKADSVRRRLASLQSSHYEILELLGAVAGGLEVEAEFHKQLVASRLRGEWFSPTAEVLACVAQSLKDGAIELDDDECVADDANARIELVMVRFTSAEREDCEQEARKSGLSLSTWIRMVCAEKLATGSSRKTARRAGDGSVHNRGEEGLRAES